MDACAGLWRLNAQVSLVTDAWTDALLIALKLLFEDLPGDANKLLTSRAIRLLDLHRRRTLMGQAQPQR